MLLAKNLSKLVLVGAMFALSACASTSTQLFVNTDELPTYSLTAVNVVIPAATNVSWGRYTREQSRIDKRVPLDGSSQKKFGNTVTTLPSGLFPTKEEHRQKMLVQPFKELLPPVLNEVMNGGRPLRAEITVKSIHIASAAQSLLIGGDSSVIAVTKLIDQETNKVVAIFDPRLGGNSGYAPGGVLGVVVGESGELNKYEKAVRDYGRDMKRWLFPHDETIINDVNQQNPTY